MSSEILVQSKSLFKVHDKKYNRAVSANAIECLYNHHVSVVCDGVCFY